MTEDELTAITERANRYKALRVAVENLSLPLRVCDEAYHRSGFDKVCSRQIR